ncbi:hypothetical protein C8Q77DRAFT_1120975 [Trametes polyzona]|nr:hypothetical protein C8Q77DRAFT_1120975 [Trametes polyzona]
MASSQSASTSLVLFLTLLLAIISQCIPTVLASPYRPLPTELAQLKHNSATRLTGRQDGAEPVFPDQPPSCPICEQNFGSISSCAQAAPVLANFSMIIFNPGAFIDVIKCACADTFQSVYPQCVDCFTQTNQTQFLNNADVPKVVEGIRDVCALESTLLGGVATADGEVTPTSSVNVPQPTETPNGAVSFGSAQPATILVGVVSLIALLL